MSNLLNNDKPKRKLLQRGPKIMPAQEFKLEETVETPTASAAEDTPLDQSAQKPAKAEPKASAKTTKKQEAPKITSVRVTKPTRNKLNALVQLGKADNVDTLIDIILDEYIETNLLADEKKTYNLIYNIIQKRDR